jgi:hypothetical protein
MVCYKGILHYARMILSDIMTIRYGKFDHFIIAAGKRNLRFGARCRVAAPGLTRDGQWRT